MGVNVKVNTTELSSQLSSLADAALREIETTLRTIAESAEKNAEDKWYTQVTKRTGATQAGISTRTNVADDKIRAVVFSTNKVTYVIKTPGPLSLVYKYPARFPFQKGSDTGTVYGDIMSFFRLNGRLPDGWEATRYNSNGQPINLRRIERNPKAGRGKNVWQMLVRKEGGAIALSRMDDVEAALQRASDRMFGR